MLRILYINDDVKKVLLLRAIVIAIYSRNIIVTHINVYAQLPGTSTRTFMKLMRDQYMHDT